MYNTHASPYQIATRNLYNSIPLSIRGAVVSVPNCESADLGSNPGLGSRRAVYPAVHSSFREGRLLGTWGNLEQVKW